MAVASPPLLYWFIRYALHIKNRKKNLQCSEICGVYHGFMPIAIDSLPLIGFLSFLDSTIFFFTFPACAWYKKFFNKK